MYVYTKYPLLQLDDSNLVSSFMQTVIWPCSKMVFSSVQFCKSFITLVMNLCVIWLCGSCYLFPCVSVNRTHDVYTTNPIHQGSRSYSGLKDQCNNVISIGNRLLQGTTTCSLNEVLTQAQLCGLIQIIMQDHWTWWVIVVQGYINCCGSYSKKQHLLTWSPIIHSLYLRLQSTESQIPQGHPQYNPVPVYV